MNMATGTGMAMTGTHTMNMPASHTGGSMDMGGMDHGDMDMGMGKCKISMLFNLNTIGSCFFTEDWYIATAGQFAGACIAAVLLVTALEMLRRAAREYDRHLIKTHVDRYQIACSAMIVQAKDSGSDSESAVKPRIPTLRPTVVQQGIRAFLHMLQFGLAYIIMLLAMYYNGYIFLSIVLGSFIGYFAFNWEPLINSDETGSGKVEATVCCG